MFAVFFFGLIYENNLWKSFFGFNKDFGRDVSICEVKIFIYMYLFEKKEKEL